MDTSKYKALYLQEANEHLSGIEKGLLALEKGEDNPSPVENLFRHYHSIKGMSASMGYEVISRLSHAQEDLLDRVRSKRLTLSGAMLTALFKCTDALKELIKRVEEDKPLTYDVDPLINEIRGLIEGRTPAPQSAAPTQELKLSQTMKVDVKIFDGLLASAGDLFMTLSSFKTLTQGLRSIAVKDSIHTLGKSINTLYDNIISARMLPIKDLTEGLPRVVRDISNDTGKTVALKVEGAEISVDRAILENLASPLVHIIRNAVDHGIEPPGKRVEANKPPGGTITINAYIKKNRVIIEVSDDGGGIDREKVIAKAIRMGVPAERIRAMSDEDVLMLVCTPGLSVKEEVTEISGRGVGMDVVKSSVESFGGGLRIESERGLGTKVIMELPRTSSIVKALLVTAGSELFLLPVSRIEQVLEAKSAQLSGGKFKYGGRDIPLISLDKALGMKESSRKDVYTVVIVEGGGKAEGAVNIENSAAIKVDDFMDEIDAYIKPLLPPISKLWGVSGITVMADGRPVFLLDVRQIISRALKRETSL